jgi:hypothetical protein
VEPQEQMVQQEQLDQQDLVVLQVLAPQSHTHTAQQQDKQLLVVQTLTH